MIEDFDRDNYKDLMKLYEIKNTSAWLITEIFKVQHTNLKLKEIIDSSELTPLVDMRAYLTYKAFKELSFHFIINQNKDALFKILKHENIITGRLTRILSKSFIGEEKQNETTKV